MITVAENVPFIDLCKLCERVCEKSGKDKHKLLEQFIRTWREYHVKLHKNDLQTQDSFFPAMRLLLPQCERDRAAYGIKEHTLAKLYIAIFCLDKNSSDAQKLLNYRSPKIVKAEAGDFASVAYFILQKRCPDKSSLKIHDVNHYLDRISTGNATKNKDEVKASLQFLIMKTTALEQKWLIRMILKDMKLGVSENSLLKTYHIDAPDLYNVTNSLQKVCFRLKDPSIRLHEIEISIFTPFRPMLSEQVLPEKVEKAMNNQPFFIEVKYDGERVQLHKHDNMYMYFSRNAFEVTNVYGSSPLDGSLTPYIGNCFKTGVSKCILDGEMVIYSNKNKCIVSKGENPEIQAADPDGDYHPCFCPFDILLLNDKVLSNLPLTERITILKNIINPVEGKIQLTEQKTAYTKEDVAAALNEAIDNRLEGIIIKDPNSVYHPNTRKAGGWIKIKPDYIDNLMDELDLLIIGGYFGEGRRSSKISHFLLGVAEPTNAQGEDPHTFLSVAKVGSGYSEKELDKLLASMAPHWEVYNQHKAPEHIIIGGGRKEKPDVWIEPKASCIVQVRAAEIIRSEKFATNYTLRFPRVQKIRYDKLWHECLTTVGLDELRMKAEGRLANKYELPAADEGPSPKKPRKIQEHVINVAPQFRPADVSNVEQVSELMKNKEFCVISSNLSFKQFLEKAIAEHGGKFVQNPGPGLCCVLTDYVTLKVSNIIKAGLYDVVNSSWLTRCIEKKAWIPWTPDDMIHMTKVTQATLREDFDEYGDNYMEDSVEEDLKKVFNSINKKDWEHYDLTPKEIADIEYEYFTSSKFGLFRTCRIYIDDKKHIGDNNSEVIKNKFELLTLKLRLYGGVIATDIDNAVTHVVLHTSDTSRLLEIKRLSSSRKTGRFYIVTEKWVKACIKYQNLLQEKEYYPKKCA